MGHGFPIPDPDAVHLHKDPGVLYVTLFNSRTGTEIISIVHLGFQNALVSILLAGAALYYIEY